MNEYVDPHTPIVIIDRDPTFFETVRPLFQAKGYTPLLTSWHEDVLATVVEHQPIAVVIKLAASDMPVRQVLTMLQDDPAIRHTLVLICSDNATLRQNTVAALRQRPGSVLASSCNADELIAKLPTTPGAANAA